MDNEHELIWEAVENLPGVSATVMEPTEDGWHCVAVVLEPGAIFTGQCVECTTVITIAEGCGVLAHDGRKKNYQPMTRYTIGQGGNISIEHVWSKTMLAVTWPPQVSA